MPETTEMFAPSEATASEGEALQRLRNELIGLLEAMDRAEAAFDPSSVHPSQATSAFNVIDYVTLRQQDLRGLQDELTQRGLSSLGRCEAYVRNNIEAVLSLLSRLIPQVAESYPPPGRGLSFQQGMALLHQRSSALFGPRPPGRSAHIMVTMPTEAAKDYRLVRDLVGQGMSCMRINCSHDGPEVWQKIIEHLKRAKGELNRECKVAMDLGGPKLRTCGLPAGVSSIRIRPKSRILMTSDSKNIPSSLVARFRQMPQIGCTLGQVFSNVRPGERVLFDDGRISGVVKEVDPAFLMVEISRGQNKIEKLKGDKGINLPDSNLRLAALTNKDIDDLEFVVSNADVVSYSFVRHPDDVRQLQNELIRLGRGEMPMILKIENREAFERLPSLLLSAMKSPLVGVMIARGDLAVEMGYERLAEVQEEILWICESAHVPVVWATQVLEQLAKRGTPSRAEVTDAAMGVRAECVMLNKGPFILDAVKTLSDILTRMQDHQSKKRPLLRRLRLADNLGSAAMN